jgi:hypothetical protein
MSTTVLHENGQIFASRYKPVLPSEEALAQDCEKGIGVDSAHVARVCIGLSQIFEDKRSGDDALAYARRYRAENSHSGFDAVAVRADAPYPGASF